MEQKKSIWRYFTAAEYALWGGSAALVLAAFLIFDRGAYLTLAASLIGVTSLIFCAKGNPIGQVLIIAFSLLYGYISYTCAYYGEMLTYLGMTTPMAIYALVMWLRHPYKGSHAQVEVGRLSRRAYGIMAAATIVVTVAFFFILRELGTANLWPSTFSVATSFLAVCLTARRSPLFALAYAANDLVLILLWILAARRDPSYLSVIVCFGVFLVNDLYGYASWIRMKRYQQATP